MSVLTIAAIFLRIGALGFGGLGAALALIERELVQNRGALRSEDVAEALTYTKLLPGSTVVQVVSYLGYRLGGWSGSALATAAFILPSALMMVALAAAYGVLTLAPASQPAIRGLTAAVVGILLATTYRLARSNIKEPLTLALALIAFGTGALLGVHAALLVVGAGLVGTLVLSGSGRQRPAAREAGQ